MGQAKRRQQQDPAYGHPIAWRVEILDQDGAIADFDLQVPRMDLGVNHINRAEALTVIVMSALQEPCELNWKRLERSLGPDTRRALEELQPELPKDFWLDLYQPDGQQKGSCHSTEEAIRLSGHDTQGELRAILPEHAQRFAGRH